MGQDATAAFPNDALAYVTPRQASIFPSYRKGKEERVTLSELMHGIQLGATSEYSIN